MHTKAEHAAYMRQWRKDHPGQARATDKAYRDKTKRYRDREKQLGRKTCAFCTILLTSRTVAMKSKRYCDSCRNDPKIRRYLKSLYHRRWQQKKVGVQQDSLTLAED